jgi:hypothetical protein
MAPLIVVSNSHLGPESAPLVGGSGQKHPESGNRIPWLPSAQGQSVSANGGLSEGVGLPPSASLVPPVLPGSEQAVTHIDEAHVMPTMNAIDCMTRIREYACILRVPLELYTLPCFCDLHRVLKLLSYCFCPGLRAPKALGLVVSPRPAASR